MKNGIFEFLSLKKVKIFTWNGGLITEQFMDFGNGFIGMGFNN